MINDDMADYIDQVIDRARKLIRARIWEGIKEDRLDAWLGCLRNFDAELLAAYLLDNLSFRSRDQFFSLLDTVFADLPITANCKQHSSPSLLECLRLSKADNPACSVRIAPVIGHLAPPTKSGPYILRLAQRRFKIDSDWLIWPHLLDTADTITDLYFLDDFCGSGNQFDEFAVGIRLADFMKHHPKLQVTYLVATIHTKGLERISEKYPSVKLKWAEHLCDVNSPFSQNCFERYQVAGFKDLIEKQYVRVVKMAGLPQSGVLANGYGDLRLAYAFAHATPNNTLPIFWEKTQSLTPLLDR